jgi:hypothetical protein
VNAITGTNWEQVGVVPDLSCRAADALDLAQAELSGPPGPVRSNLASPS